MSLVDVQRRLITIDQAAERLGLSRRTVERKIEQGVIPALQLGARGTAIRIDERELEQWLHERRSMNVSDDGSRQGQLRADADPAERRAPEPSAVEARQPAGEKR